MFSSRPTRTGTPKTIEQAHSSKAATSTKITPPVVPIATRQESSPFNTGLVVTVLVVSVRLLNTLILSAFALISPKRVFLNLFTYSRA